MATFTREESKSEGGGGSMKLPAGEHQVEIIKASMALSKNKNEMIRLTLRNQRGYCDTQLTLTPAAVWVAFLALESIGKIVPVGQDFDFTPEEFLGYEARVLIKEGVTGWPEVDKWLPSKKAGPQKSFPDLGPDEIPF